jgi:hypothetical protein
MTSMSSEARRKYYLEHREKELRQARIWSTTHREQKTECTKKYRQTKKGREATLRAIKKYEKSHPERRSVWTKARKIEKKPCVICGKKQIHRHHPDISRPLDVIFVCPLHHKRLHSVSL